MSKSGKLAAPVVETSDRDQERKWRAEDGLRTLTEAEKVKRDPKLMADIEKARKAKMADLASIQVEVAPKTIKGPK